MKLYWFESVLACLVFFSGCRDNPDPEIPAGKIIGYVKLVELNGNRPENKQGIKVSIQHTADHSFTDSTGKYEINDIEPGNVNIIFEKDSFGTSELFRIENPGGYFPVIPPEVYLYKIPEISLTEISISNDEKYIYIKGNVSPTDRWWAEGFFNDSANVAINHFDYYGETGTRKNTLPEDFFFEIPMTDTPIRKAPFHAGQTIYGIFYFRNPFEGTVIFDPDSNMSYYTSRGKKSAIVQYTVQ